jgi:NAD(P)-dependent dehydrogenase (short-subunit alcohol dehydrogenase family)
MGKLDGKVAIVTGAGDGIGRAMATALAAEGATVVVSDISGRQDEVAAEIGGGATAVRADVSVEDDIHALIQGTAEQHGRLDVLCNNAGIDGDIAPLAECTMENYDRVLAINLRGVFMGMRYAIPEMLKNGGGSIINTASVAAFVAFEGASPYCAAKAGVVGLTRSAAVEYSRAGVRVNAICPGVIRTSLMEQLPPDLYQQVLTGAEQMSAVKRVGLPSEVAATAVFLASDDSSFITGTTINVDGGWTAI